jgi:hypothetical protein
MKNPIDYLWYKMYKWLCYIGKSGKPATDIGCVSVLLSLNLLCIIMLIYENIHDSFLFILVISCAVVIFPYMSSKKQSKILAEYEKESEKSRITGNIIVTIYVILSFAAPLIIAKIKNGYIFVD